MGEFKHGPVRTWASLNVGEFGRRRVWTWTSSNVDESEHGRLVDVGDFGHGASGLVCTWASLDVGDRGFSFERNCVLRRWENDSTLTKG